MLQEKFKLVVWQAENLKCRMSKYNTSNVGWVSMTLQIWDGQKWDLKCGTTRWQNILPDITASCIFNCKLLKSLFIISLHILITQPRRLRRLLKMSAVDERKTLMMSILSWTASGDDVCIRPSNEAKSSSPPLLITSCCTMPRDWPRQTWYWTIVSTHRAPPHSRNTPAHRDTSAHSMNTPADTRHTHGTHLHTETPAPTFSKVPRKEDFTQWMLLTR